MDDDAVAQLTPEETAEALALVEKAENTPAILVVAGDSRVDVADRAWDAIREFQSRMAEKHGFDETECAITKTGKVVLYP